jgi:hypothetical protein
MTTAEAPRSGRAAERRFYAGMAWGILAVVFLGFARTYYLRPLFPDLHSRTAQEVFFYAVHGALFTAWVVLLAVQPPLIAGRRLDLHRRLGWIGAVLAAAMVVTGVAGALIAARRPTGFSGAPLPTSQFLIIPLVDMLLFGTFVALAILWRRDPQAHKRLMLAASINLTTAALARIPLSVFRSPIAFSLATDLWFVPMIVWDLVTRRRLHPVTLWTAVVTLVSHPLRIAVSGTEAWARFAAWLIG